MTDKRRDELEQTIRAMREAARHFYANAVETRCHPFIEFTGLMNEYILICQDSLREGIDFTDSSRHTGRPLVVQGYQWDYLAEKFGCIFGPSLKADAEGCKRFWKGVMDEEAEDGDAD